MENLIRTTLLGLQQQRGIQPNYNKLYIAPTQILQLLKESHATQVCQQGRKCTEEVAELEDVARWLHISVQNPWLIIYGSVGNGKTTTIKAIASIYEALKRNADEALKNRGMMSRESMLQIEAIQRVQRPTIHSALHVSAQAGKSPEEYEKIKNCAFLIIDDVGVEPTRVMHYGTEINPIEELLFHRYDRRMMTIITTNKDDEELPAIYGERIADRFREVASTVGYLAESYR